MQRRGVRSTTLVIGGLALALLSVFASNAPAEATPSTPASSGADLVVSVRADNALAPVVVLANRGSAPCRVAATLFGTASATHAAQNGNPITPIPVDVVTGDGLDRLIGGRLRTLAPGGSIELPVPVINVGPTGHALELVSWSAAGGTSGTIVPVVAGKPLDLGVRYAVPVAVPDSPRLCTAAASTGRAWYGGVARWAAVSAAALFLALVVVLVLVARRRHRSRAGLLAALVVLALLSLEARAPVPPAFATITLGDKALEQRYNGCVSTFSSTGGDPESIFPTLDQSGVKVLVSRPANAGDTHTIRISRTETVVFWDADTVYEYAGGGGFNDPCTGLYHELYHAYDILNGTLNPTPCVTAAGPSSVPTSEVKATRAQNKLRRKLQMPERTHYGNTPLPKGECLPRDQRSGNPSAAPTLRLDACTLLSVEQVSAAAGRDVGVATVHQNPPTTTCYYLREDDATGFNMSVAITTGATHESYQQGVATMRQLGSVNAIDGLGDEAFTVTWDEPWGLSPTGNISVVAVLARRGGFLVQASLGIAGTPMTVQAVAVARAALHALP
jgi:hypothetical protein